MTNLPDLSTHAAVLFDLDGVITPTADVHRRAWAEVLSAYLQEHGVAEAYSDDDYTVHLDGKQRYDGVESFLLSRGLALERGTPEDPASAETVCGIGNRKNEAFTGILSRDGVKPYPGAVALLERLEALGTRVALVSSSRNALRVLEAAGLRDRFPVVVDGLSSHADGLASKPAPDMFLHAARSLGVNPADSVVIEDAVSGVQAGVAGGFGLVVGVDSGAGRSNLLEAGAHLVLDGLADLAAAAVDGRFGSDPWKLTQTRFPRGVDGHAETLFALGNGYLGLRGNMEEGGPAHEHGTFINGLHETWDIEYPEAGYGFARVGQTIVNAPDAKTLRVEVDGEAFDPRTALVTDYSRSLDFRTGAVSRSLTWQLASGKRVALTSRRLVSFEHRHLAVVDFGVTALDAAADVRLVSLIINRQDGEGELGATGEAPRALAFDPRRTDSLKERVLQPVEQAASGDGPVMVWRVTNSGMKVAVMVRHSLEGETELGADLTRTTFSRKLAVGTSLRLEQLIAWHDAPAGSGLDLKAACAATLEAASRLGTDAIMAGQRTWLDSFWTHADITVRGQPPQVQQAIRWNLLQLAMASARADGRGISAKGVSGSGYSGHYFWDTEIYVLPFLTFCLPAAARSALRFRHALLPAARQRARTMSVEGALYPWRTINGEEASAYYPAGSAQYHINADVAHAVMRYAHYAGDAEYMEAEGAEVLFETARMWASLGFFRGDPGVFHIHSVTGPDEYSAVVNDNLYTNVMARENLRAAAEAAAAHPEVASRCGVTVAESASWSRAAAAMCVPFDEALGIHAQDAEFLTREVWDVRATPRSRRPLLLHYHPLVIYRHQVLKQADLVLAQFLQARHFTPDQKRRDFDYYDPITTGDSTLSAAVQSIMAAEVGFPDAAMRHFRHMLYTDLHDLHRNTADGVHVASTGGAWLTLVGGFGGLRDDGGELRFDPRLPEGWEELAFRLRVRGSSLRVRLRPSELRFDLEAGPPVELSVRGEGHLIDGTTSVPL